MTVPRILIKSDELLVYPSMDTEVRTQKFAALRRIATSSFLSLAKKQVLLALLTYAEKDLKSKSIFTAPSVDRFNTYNDIICHLYMPDLFFVHHVSLEIDKIQHAKSDLRDIMTPVLKQCNRGLRRQHINDTRGVLLGFVVMAAFLDPKYAFVLLLALAAAETLLPKDVQPSTLFVNKRFEDGYENYLAAPYKQESEQALLHDGLDDHMAKIGRIGRRGVDMLLSGIVHRIDRTIASGEQKQLAGQNPPVREQIQQAIQQHGPTVIQAATSVLRRA